MTRRAAPKPHRYTDAASMPGYCSRCARPEANALHRDPNHDLMPERSDADALREAGQQQAHDARSNQSARDAVYAAILRWVSGNPRAEIVTANEIRPLVPAGISSGLMGACFARMQRDELLAFVDYAAKSTDPGTHGKRINRWGITPALRALAERNRAA